MTATKSFSATTEPEPVWDVALLFPAQGNWTEHEYLSLTDSTNCLIEFDNGRIEVLDMPTEAHQLIVRYMFLALHGFVTRRKLGTVLFAPLRLRTEETKFREPDVVLMLASNKNRRENRYWLGADLAVEVVSDDPKSRERDLHVKRTEYALAGISEYWIVDPANNQITVLRLDGFEYVMHGTYEFGQLATSTLLEGFAVDVTRVFEAAIEE